MCISSVAEECQDLFQRTRGIHPMLFHCWASVEDGGPTLKQQGVNALCLLGWTWGGGGGDTVDAFFVPTFVQSSFNMQLNLYKCLAGYGRRRKACKAGG